MIGLYCVLEVHCRRHFCIHYKTVKRQFCLTEISHDSTKLDGCIVRNATIQYSARSCLLPAFEDAYFVSRACDSVMSALSAVLITFSFQFMSAFLSYRSARPHSGALVYAILDIGRCRKFEEFLRFFGKTTPYGKIFKILFESFPCYTDRRC